MRHSSRAAVIVTLLLGFGAVSASDDAFEANFAKAKANAATKEGAAYDAALSAAYEAMPDFRSRMEDCMLDSPAPHDLHGYLLFSSKKDFSVVLRPQDEFSDCVTQALASPSVPEPPTVPYLNPFVFTL
jgi:hypothetical protein